jgi:four helix bundle protein
LPPPVKLLVLVSEGFGRWNAREFARFLSIANGSLRELETHFAVAQRLGYISAQDTTPVFQATDELVRMIYSMRTKIQSQLSVQKSHSR